MMSNREIVQSLHLPCIREISENYYHYERLDEQQDVEEILRAWIPFF